MMTKPKRPVLRLSFNDTRRAELNEAARQEARQATIAALMDEAKDG